MPFLCSFLPGFGVVSVDSITATGTVSADKFRASASKSNTDVAFGFTGADSTGWYTIAGKLAGVVSASQSFEITGAAVATTAGILLAASSRVDIAGGIANATPPAIKTASSYTMVAASDYFVRFDTTSTAITVALPAAASSRGVTFVIRKDVASVNALTIDPNGAELINGAATLVVPDSTAHMIICDGAAWFSLGTL
jgi:hypothetical protein